MFSSLFSFCLLLALFAGPWKPACAFGLALLAASPGGAGTGTCHNTMCPNAGLAPAPAPPFAWKTSSPVCFFSPFFFPLPSRPRVLLPRAPGQQRAPLPALGLFLKGGASCPDSLNSGHSLNGEGETPEHQDGVSQKKTPILFFFPSQQQRRGGEVLTASQRRRAALRARGQGAQGVPGTAPSGPRFVLFFLFIFFSFPNLGKAHAAEVVAISSFP